MKFKFQLSLMFVCITLMANGVTTSNKQKLMGTLSLTIHNASVHEFNAFANIKTMWTKLGKVPGFFGGSTMPSATKIFTLDGSVDNLSVHFEAINTNYPVTAVGYPTLNTIKTGDNITGVSEDELKQKLNLSSAVCFLDPILSLHYTPRLIIHQPTPDVDTSEKETENSITVNVNLSCTLSQDVQKEEDNVLKFVNQVRSELKTYFGM